MTITARFASRCGDCGAAIHVGDLIDWHKGARPRHAACASARTSPVTARAERGATSGPRRPADRRCTCHDEAFDGECAYHADQQYRQGLAEGRLYSAERRIYGDALAEQFAMQDELNRYNRGED